VNAECNILVALRKDVTQELAVRLGAVILLE